MNPHDIPVQNMQAYKSPARIWQITNIKVNTHKYENKPKNLNPDSNLCP
jgi:hypothetical protein